jgi:hypothetical protein
MRTDSRSFPDDAKNGPPFGVALRRKPVTGAPVFSLTGRPQVAENDHSTSEAESPFRAAGRQPPPLIADPHEAGKAPVGSTLPSQACHADGRHYRPIDP